MFRHKSFRGHALRIVVGITILVLLMAGGVQALPGTNILSHSDINNKYIMHRMDAGIPSNKDVLQARSMENAAIMKSTVSWYISDNETGGDCISIGTWNVVSKTCTLTTDLNITIEIDGDNIILDGNGHTLTGNSSGYGIYLSERSGVTIKNINVKSFYDGIYMEYSSNNVLIGNNATSNVFDGINMYDSINNMISSNNMNSNGDDGIFLDDSNNNTLIGNNVSNNTYGGYLYNSSNNILFNNTMKENSFNFGVWGWSDSDFNNQIDYGNTVDGKPIYYVKNANNTVYGSSTNAGMFYCISCLNVTIMDIELLRNDAGIFFWNTTYSKIQNVTVSKNYDGIDLVYSSNNIVINNNANSNEYDGIYLYNSSKNTLNDNNPNSNMHNGIHMTHSSNNTLSGNNIISNVGDGIYLNESQNNMLSGNNHSYNIENGICLFYSNNNNILGNNITLNEYGGIYLAYSSNNNISWNNANENNDSADNGEGYGDGIGLYYSDSNNIIGNNASYNHEAGIYLSSSSSNLIYNNYFNNTNNSGFSGTNINTWNTTLQSGTNIIGGFYLGGNFWADPNGTGFSQTCGDDNSDGLCDLSHSLDSNNIDYLSLAYYSGTPSPTLVDSYLPPGETPEVWKAGVIRAMDDYFAEPPLLTKSQLLSVMDAYFE